MALSQFEQSNYLLVEQVAEEAMVAAIHEPKNLLNGFFLNQELVGSN